MVLQLAAIVLHLAAMVLHFAAIVLQVAAIVLQFADIVLQLAAMVLQLAAMVLQVAAMVLHVAAMVLQVAAMVPAHKGECPPLYTTPKSMSPTGLSGIWLLRGSFRLSRYSALRQAREIMSFNCPGNLFSLW